jgi:hypothetical protein
MIEWRSNEFIAGPVKPTESSNKQNKVEQVPFREVPLFQQKMYSTSLKYLCG